MAGQLRNVVIDRCFIDADGTRWVIDYKTSSHEGGGREEFLASELARYAEAIFKTIPSRNAAACQAPARKCTTCIWPASPITKSIRRARIGMGRFGLFSNSSHSIMRGRRAGQRRHPGNEAPLKRLGIECRKNIAEVIV